MPRWFMPLSMGSFMPRLTNAQPDRVRRYPFAGLLALTSLLWFTPASSWAETPKTPQLKLTWRGGELLADVETQCTEERKVDVLLPHKKTPRKISKEQAGRLKQSLETYGLVEIPAVDLDGTILAGHQRIKVLQLLGRGNEQIDVRALKPFDFKETWDYLQTLPKLDMILPFDNIAILKKVDNKWVPEKVWELSK